MDAMSELTESHRQVIEQIYFRGRTVAETALLMDLPAGTVKSRSYYALRALRQAIEPRVADVELAT